MRNTDPQEADAAGPGATATDVRITEQDRWRMLQIVIGGAGSAETWLLARIVLLASQSISSEEIGEIAGVDPDTVGRVIRSFHRYGLPA